MKSVFRTFVLTSTLLAPSLIGRTAFADTVVQIPVDSILDARTVSTLTGGTVVPWIAGQGVYNDGCCGAYATAAVKAQLAPTAAGEGLPDDGLFPATANLPPFQLHFSNAAPATSPQTVQVHQTTGPQSFQFAVPPATYSALYLILTSSEGTSNFTVTLSYAGGTPSSMSTIMLPDSGIGVQTGGSAHFYLITDTGKWNTMDQDTETTGHTIEGIELTPTAGATLTGVQVAKTNSAHLVFWGATGIATSPVDAGVVSSSDAESSQDSEAPLDAAASSGSVTASGSPSGSASGTSTGEASGEATSGAAGSGSSSSGAETAESGAQGASGTTTGTSASGSAQGSGSSTTNESSSNSTSGCSLARGPSRDSAGALLAVVGLVLASRRRTRRRNEA